MDESEILKKVVECVSFQFGVGECEIRPETHFINDLNADSLDAVEFVMELEEEFEIMIPDEDAAKITTVGQAVEYVKQSITV